MGHPGLGVGSGVTRRVLSRVLKPGTGRAQRCAGLRTCFVATCPAVKSTRRVWRTEKRRRPRHKGVSIGV